MSEPLHYHPDDLRRLATELLSRSGLGRERASSMGRFLLWYDAIGAHDFGIAELDAWLLRLERGDFDAGQEGRIGPEHASTAVLEARRGFPPLLLTRAAEIAGQKARDTGVGIIQLIGLPPEIGPTAAIAAELAIGPFAGLILGPRSAQSAAVPAAEGVPVVYDSLLGAQVGKSETGAEHPAGPIGTVIDRLAPWAFLSGGDEVLVVAVAVSAFESLGSFHNRVAEAIQGRDEPDGWIFPSTWQRRRLQIQQRGIPLPEPIVAGLRSRAEAAGVTMPRAID